MANERWEGVRITDHGVYVGRKRCAPGWHREWIFENVYGWTWYGPFRWHGQVDLVVLNHEPGADERRRIEADFSSAPPPHGEDEFDVNRPYDPDHRREPTEIEALMAEVFDRHERELKRMG